MPCAKETELPRKFYLDFHRVHMAMATNADQRKWRQSVFPSLGAVCTITLPKRSHEKQAQVFEATVAQIQDY